VYIPTRYAPVRHCSEEPFDLHVLGLPPAFVLSQDQTLKFESIKSLKIEFWLFEVYITSRPALILFAALCSPTKAYITLYLLCTYDYE
jgi:hypothetical protein